jgi:hypothetical protein
MRKRSSLLPLMAFTLLVGLALPAMAAPAAAPPTSPLDALANPLALSPVVLLGVQLLKMIPIPFEGKSAAGIVAALTLITLLLKVAIALLTHTVDQLDPMSLWTEGQSAVITLLAAAGIYSVGKKALVG